MPDSVENSEETSQSELPLPDLDNSDGEDQQDFSTQHRIGVNLLRHCGVQL